MDGDGLTYDLLVRSIAHELRQGLTVILGYAELLETHEMGGADRAAAAAKIQAAGERLRGVLDRLERGDPTARVRFGPNGEHELLDLRA